MSTLKSIARDWLPPAIVRAIQHVRGGSISFHGNYSTWDEAINQCTGYDAEQILSKVLEATIRVKSGEAAYERDSVEFDRIEYAWPITAGLMWSAAQNGGRMDVLDFGGALGSSYFQNRFFLAELSQVRWSVIEQSHYVEAGRKYIEDDRLRFYKTIDECLLERQPNVLVFSSVLQYLSEPIKILNNLLDLNFEYLLIDRTPILNEQLSALIKVQCVPASIYSASYPCWFFEYREFVGNIENFGFKLIEEFYSLDKLSDIATWRGFIFKRSVNQ